jgi:protein ImuA
LQILETRLHADPSRVVLRPFHLGWQAVTADGDRARTLVEDIGALGDRAASAEYRRVLADFSERHWQTEQMFEQRYSEVEAGLGIDPARLVIVDAPDELGVLRAGLEAARCPQVATVLLEAEGRFAAYDLTASRRLALAAERNRNRVIVLRLDAEPRASAAQTRWALASAPSLPLEAGAPGWPALDAELLRWRGGAAGERWRFEWDEQDGGFHGPIEPAPLPRLVVPAVRGGAGPAGAGADTAAEPRAA